METAGRYLLPASSYSFLVPQRAWPQGDLRLPCSLVKHKFDLGVSDSSLLFITFMSVFCGNLSSSGLLSHIHVFTEDRDGLGLETARPTLCVHKAQ